MSFALLLASGILLELLKKRLGIGVKKQLGWCLIAICGSLFCAFSVLTFHHSGGPLDWRLSLRHQETMRI